MTEYGISAMSCVKPKTAGEYILDDDSRTKMARCEVKNESGPVRRKVAGEAGRTLCRNSGSIWAIRMAGSVTR